MWDLENTLDHGMIRLGFRVSGFRGLGFRVLSQDHVEKVYEKNPRRLRCKDHIRPM